MSITVTEILHSLATGCKGPCGERSGAGETIPCEPINLQAVCPEITWGKTYRQRKSVEKQNVLLPKSAPEHAQKCSKKMNVWRPELPINKNIKRLFEDKLVCDSKVVNRSALTTRQHIKLLAEPKRMLYIPSGKHLTRRCPRNCTPRLVQLSIPSQRRVIATWNDFQQTLPIAKIDKLSNIINPNLSLELTDAEKCFQELKTVDNKNKKKLNRKFRVLLLKKQKKLRLWIELKSYYFAVLFADYLCTKDIFHLSHYQKQISSDISRWLVKTHKVNSLNVKRRSMFKQGLLHAVDKCSIFAYNVLAAAESGAEKSIYAPDSMYEGDSTITPIPSTPAPTIVDIVCVQTPEEYPEEYLEVDVLEPSPSAEIAAAELELMKLCEVLTSFYEKRFDLHGEPIFSDPTLPQLTLDKLLMDVVGIAESREITKPFNRLTKAFQKKLMAYTREVDPDAMNALMLEVIGFVSHELAKAYITEMLREPLLEVEGELEDEYIQEIEYIKTKPEENNLIEAETPKQSLLSSMLSSSKSAVIDVASSPSLSVAVTIDSSVLLETEPEQELILPPEPNEVLGHEEHEEFIVERSKLVIMPHSPNMVCCASLKAWASWIKEIIENAKMWCIWINQTIRDMRRMAAMLKGNVYDDNGQVVTLSRNDWNQFVVKLDRDIVAWRHYNQHVQEITDAILSHYNDKRVACCALCLEEDLHLSELGADHICEQLHEALQTTLYWRRWLHSMVSEAEALTTLMDEADIATLIEVTSSTELLAIAGATIITNRPTTTSSSTSSSSTYSIRAIGSRPPPSPRRPSQ